VYAAVIVLVVIDVYSVKKFVILSPLFQDNPKSQYQNGYVVASHPGLLSLAIPFWVGTVSTSDSWEINRHTT